MEQKKRTITTSPVGSDITGDGDGLGIVPAQTPSSSEYGLDATRATGVALELATVDTKVTNKEEQTQVSKSLNTATEMSIPVHHRSMREVRVILDKIPIPDPDPSPNPSLITNPNPMPIPTLNPNLINNLNPNPNFYDQPETIPTSESQSWADIVAEEERNIPDDSDVTMEIDDDGSPIRKKVGKRKVRGPIDTDSLDDDLLEASREAPMRTRAARKKRATAKTQDSDKPTAGPDNLLVAGATSAPCSNQENVPSGSDADNQRGKVGRPRRKAKAIDPIMAEQAILNKTGKAPHFIEEELLRCMTASDICAQALDYLTAIEIIRTRSGHLQANKKLSGELRRRVQGLEGFVRALQIRAEATGDPQALQLRIEELIKEVKEYRKEKERRKMEVSDLQEIIRDLRKENKEIREEMRKSFKEIRDSIEKDVHGNSVHSNANKDVRRSVNKDVYSYVNMDVHCHENKEDTPLPQRVRKTHGNNLVAASPELNTAEWPALKNHVNPEYKGDWVLRPSLQGRQTPIPVREDLYSVTSKSTNTLNNNVPTMIFTGKANAENKPLRTDIRVKENIQVAPPYSERNAPPIYPASQLPPPPPLQTNQE